VIVLVHGFAASSEEPDVVALAQSLHASGFEVIAYDARGHGGSTGACTLGDLERHDVASAVAAAGGAGVPTVVVGASMGAIATLHYAALRDLATPSPSIAGLVMVSCPARWTLPRNARGILSAVMTQTSLGRWVARRHLGVRIARHLRRPPAPVEMVARIEVPIAIVHGTDDPFIGVAAAIDLHDAASDPRRLTIVEGMGHAIPAAATVPVQQAVEWVLDDAAE
jgi:pimeloyl-ACP methyl ester carboxylesterase